MPKKLHEACPGSDKQEWDEKEMGGRKRTKALPYSFNLSKLQRTRRKLHPADCNLPSQCLSMPGVKNSNKFLVRSGRKHCEEVSNNHSATKVDGDQKRVRGVEIVETMLRVIKDKLELSLCDEVKRCSYVF